MTKTPSHAKGDRTEREAVHLIRRVLGIEVRRTKPGHASDWGDLHGLPATTVQVKGYANVTAGLREGLVGLVAQQANARTPFACLFLRRPAGRFAVCMEPEQFAALWRAAQHGLASGWSVESNSEGTAP